MQEVLFLMFRMGKKRRNSYWIKGWKKFKADHGNLATTSSLDSIEHLKLFYVRKVTIPKLISGAQDVSFMN